MNASQEGLFDLGCTLADATLEAFQDADVEAYIWRLLGAWAEIGRVLA